MMADDMIREDPDDLVDKTFPCAECDRVFANPQALSGHAMTHIPAQPCPECGRDDFKSANSQARHRSMVHGVTPAYRQGKTTAPGRIGRPPRAALDHGMKVDHIFQSVVQSLYPGGQMPTSAMAPLMEWREATQDMLERLHGD